MTDSLIKVPVSAIYRKIDGKMVQVHTEYREVTEKQFVDAMTRIIFKEFGLSFKEEMKE